MHLSSNPAPAITATIQNWWGAAARPSSDEGSLAHGSPMREGDRGTQRHQQSWLDCTRTLHRDTQRAKAQPHYHTVATQLHIDIETRSAPRHSRTTHAHRAPRTQETITKKITHRDLRGPRHIEHIVRGRLRSLCGGSPWPLNVNGQDWIAWQDHRDLFMHVYVPLIRFQNKRK